MADPKTPNTAPVSNASASATATEVTKVDGAIAATGKKTRAANGEAKKPRNLGPKGVAKALRASVNRTNKLLVLAKKDGLTLEVSLDADKNEISLGAITFSESF